MNATITARDHLRQLDAGLLATLRDANPPCVSIYMPTHRRGQQTRENPIRFKSLLQRAREELSQDDPRLAEQVLSGPMQAVDDNDFWQHQFDALAILFDRKNLHFIRLPRAIRREFVAVADSYHIKPLIRALAAPDRYHLLAISQKSVSLYEGDRDHLDPVPLHPDIPRSLVEALGEELTGSLNVGRYGGLTQKGMFHGHHDNRDDRDMDLERYFRAIDKAIYEHHCANSDLPLYLAADVDYHDRFRKVSHHPRLQEQGVRINPDAVEVDTDRLRKEMNQIILPAMHDRTRQLFEQFGSARAAGQGSDQLADVAQAAAQGRVLTLLLSADRRIGGRIDPDFGRFTAADEADPRVDDALDDLAELALGRGAAVLVVPGEVHPTSTGLAAIYRY